MSGSFRLKWLFSQSRSTKAGSWTQPKLTGGHRKDFRSKYLPDFAIRLGGPTQSFGWFGPADLAAVLVGP
jgi:hypothetical protein